MPLENAVKWIHGRVFSSRNTNGEGADLNTYRRQREAVLNAGALQNAIFNSANFSSIATDAKGVIQIFNVGAERMLGYTAAEVVNKITPADISDSQEIIARARALSVEVGTQIAPGFEALVFKASRGIEDIYELTYIRKDKSRFPAVVSVTALRDAQDEIIGYLLIGTDNTARQQIEEERMKLDQRLRDQHYYTRSLVESSIDALMTTDPRGIMTDVNKQMEALTGCTRDELIGAPFKNYFTDPARAEAGIKRVLTEGRVTNYELTARARNGTLTVVSYNATTFHDRDRVLKGVFAAARDVTELKLFEQRLQQKTAELEEASRDKSEFIASMSNAVKFSRDGDQVTLRAARVPRAQVGQLPGPGAGRGFPLTDNEFQEFLEISVTDNGIGVSPAGLEALFKPFSQIDSGLSRKYQGTGLGLAMIKLLAELHGGTLAVESEEGEGSRFTVWLPLRAEEEIAAAERGVASPAIEASAGDRYAMIVEADMKSADLIRVHLEAEGFKVVHAATAEDALALAERKTLSLITLAIMLPQMDGWELLARFKQIPALKHVPIVIVSIVADRNKGFALGAAAVMQKPISRQELYDSLVDLGLVPVAHGGSLQVLIVDDDPRAVELIALHVADLASKVLRAYGGADAIEMARLELPDLIVLDLLMPEVNGFDVVAALHENPGTATIPG